MDAAWRLVWALPLVLAVGFVGALILKRFVMPAQPALRQNKRMSSRESLTLSDHTRVHLLELDGKVYLLVESAQQAALQSVAQLAEVSRSSFQFRPSWAQRLFKVQGR